MTGKAIIKLHLHNKTATLKGIVPPRRELFVITVAQLAMGIVCFVSVSLAMYEATIYLMYSSPAVGEQHPRKMCGVGKQDVRKK